jgi:hypothetical protein
MGDYDGTVSISHKLSEEEIRELRIILLPYFHVVGGVGIEDITDFLDYTFAMISNQKSVDYVINELIGMEMDFCGQEIARKVGKEISTFISKINKSRGVGENNTTVNKGGGLEEGEDNDDTQKGPRVVFLKVNTN